MDLREDPASASGGRVVPISGDCPATALTFPDSILVHLFPHLYHDVLYRGPGLAVALWGCLRRILQAYRGLLAEKELTVVEKIKDVQPPRGLARLGWRAPIWFYRLGLGGLLGRRFVLLNHIGRKSGQPRQAVLEVVHHNTRQALMWWLLVLAKSPTGIKCDDPPRLRSRWGESVWSPCAESLPWHKPPKSCSITTAATPLPYAHWPEFSATEPMAVKMTCAF